MKNNSSGMRKAGGGPGSRVNVVVPVRNGDRSRNVNPRGVSQIGQLLSNHATEGSSKLTRAAETFYGGRAPQGGPGGVPLGNAVATNVGGGGVGTSRTVMRSGSQTGTAVTPKPMSPGRNSFPIKFLF
jgi:hypothetical protein